MKDNHHLNSYDGVQTPPELDFVYCPKCSAKLVKRELDGMLRNYCLTCQYIQYINPLPGVAVLIEKDHKLLIGKRSQESIESGKWCLPCGFIEHHENHLAAACREVFEETGLVIKVTSLVGVSSNQINPNLHAIVTALTAEIIDGTLKAGDDLIELDWLSKDSAFPLMAFEADKIIIKKYFENALTRIPIDPGHTLSV
jgi:8-oxo-dGTP diphosphatase